MINQTDFDKAFQSGYTFQYNLPYNEGLCDVTFSIHNMGELVVTSGTLVAADPLLPPDPFHSFPQSIQPGRYPVIASVAHLRQLELQEYQSEFSADDWRIACMMLRISQKTAVTWQSTDDFGYGVDSATGSLMDMDAALVLYDLYRAELYDEYRNRLYAKFDEFDYSPLNDDCHEYRNRLYAKFHHLFDPLVKWASIQVSDTTEANVMAFTSGYGDGHYPSYWGYDEESNLACLVTDFILFRKENDD